MKKLLGIVVLNLFLITQSQADDIRDFQIEGISVGDSMLDHFSKKEIEDFFKVKNAINWYPKSKKFFTLGTFSEGEIYKQINFDLKNSDERYIIYGVDGYRRLTYEDCIKESKLILSDIKKLFSEDKISINSYEQKHPGDPYGNSIYSSHDISLDSGDVVRVICTDWGKEMEADDYFDNIDITISGKEYRHWLNTEAYGTP